MKEVSSVEDVTQMATLEDPTMWTDVCPISAIDVEGGVLALVGGEAVAVFRSGADELYALSGWDPFSRACVLARGIMGTRGGTPFVASPMHKQAFDLRTGHCLDDAAVQVPTFPVRLHEGRVLVGPRHAHLGEGP